MHIFILLSSNLDVGEVMLASYIRSRGYQARRKLLREVIQRLDEYGPTYRMKKKRKLKRRRYEGWGGSGFNMVCHIDGWHKVSNLFQFMNFLRGMYFLL